MARILKADTTDFKSIMNLYDLGTKALLSLGIVQWGDTYPSGQTLMEDLEAGHTWILTVNGMIIGTTTLDHNQDDQYLSIEWAHRADRVLVVHRVCVHPDLQGQGIAKKLMLFAEEYALEHQFQVIRLDAFLGNPYSQRLYRSLGYQEAAGYCYYPPVPIMCNCFEKAVS